MRRLRPSASRSVAAAVLAGLLLAAGPAAAAPVAGTESAATTDGRHGGHHGGTRYQSTLLAKAPADECFVDIGVDYPAGPPCEAGQPKVNQSYVWGLTRYKHRLWFGTGANINCMTSGNNLRNTEPTRNDDWVCEYGQSEIARRNPQLPPTLGDHRTPRLYTYDTKSRQMTERTDAVRAASADDANRLTTTAGIRAAGNHRGVVLLGGPALGATLNLFAFDADTGTFLGSRNFTEYGNIRHFLVADGELYTGVGVGPNGGERGLVLRWTGSKSDPFSFTEVANLPAQAVDLTVHQGRIFVTTWVGVEADVATMPGPASPTADIADMPTADDPSPPNVAGVWMSPKLSDNGPGLDGRDADGWTRVWSVLEYEPDPIIARTYGLGGLASYGGYLYWGTMHVPFKATTVHLAAYPPTDEQGVRDSVRNTQRAIGIFRGSFGHRHHHGQGQGGGGHGDRVDLLYGASELPAYDPVAGVWASTSTGYTPLYGASGFDNPTLNYTWRMVVAGGRLYVGTMDWSYLAKELQQEEPVPPADVARGGDDDEEEELAFGADLWVFESPHRPAKMVDNAGLGNYLNYGVRSMVVAGSTVYLGMANPMNLRTDPTDDVPEGGWELLKLTPKHHHH
ncbi:MULTISPECIES: hypothetical protein [unclassified Solwaraspora]|uniref:hypothetical protein n=1 Tax=unclassified Solwaraspora TaxID=2627926 RepID=UPI00248AD7BA|nr:MULTISPECIES: hypothetical protein [unclassified Solwaraspora]WBC00001.1 hypothetical protein O7553_14465 [Solwaraspora sp. WMMA2059]WBC21453.1 hypothetical protein O7543_02905 [Solwaraspora sp. WMMA2080]WJK36467.1 hypothetical protein O7610_09005 [Solwaraspora sp. WMMA2065]